MRADFPLSEGRIFPLYFLQNAILKVLLRGGTLVITILFESEDRQESTS